VFEEIFNKIVSDKLIKMIGIWDKDGLEIEKKVYLNMDHINTEVIGAEMADITARIGEFKYNNSYSITLEFEEVKVFVYNLLNDYFILVATGKDAINGKVKFYVDNFKEEIIKKL
jgi:predicted regulator of Ras-like GTPase activity (Roadblock/LC7/MglB family)